MSNYEHVKPRLKFIVTGKIIFIIEGSIIYALCFLSPPIKHSSNRSLNLLIIPNRVVDKPLLQARPQSSRRRLIANKRHQLQPHESTNFLVGRNCDSIHTVQLLCEGCIPGLPWPL